MIQGATARNVAWQAAGRPAGSSAWRLPCNARFDWRANLKKPSLWLEAKAFERDQRRREKPRAAD
jgi:hypothetical protein